MSTTATYGEILEAADKLPLEDQESLVEVLQHRLIERRRAEIVKAVEESRRDFEAGKCRTGTAADLMREILQ